MVGDPGRAGLGVSRREDRRRADLGLGRGPGYGCPPLRNLARIWTRLRPWLGLRPRILQPLRSFRMVVPPPPFCWWQHWPGHRRQPLRTLRRLRWPLRWILRRSPWWILWRSPWLRIRRIPSLLLNTPFENYPLHTKPRWHISLFWELEYNQRLKIVYSICLFIFLSWYLSRRK